MWASYLASIGIVIAGIVIGWSATSINDTIQWIVGGLYGGYAAPNVLKWVWWRLNGAGYFAGMATGVATALTLTQKSRFMEWLADRFPVWHEWLTPMFDNDIYLFPLLLLTSGGAAVVVSYLFPPEDVVVLQTFYRQVRPWGFWQPIHKQVVANDPSFESDAHFARDMVNCTVGIAWQIALCAMPVFVVTRQWGSATICAAAVAATMIILKLNWYDHLPPPHSVADGS